jgi:hypothetical protein
METIKITRPARPLIRSIAYWIATAVIVLETAAGSEWDLVLKEWAYAGIFFDLTGAAVSNAVSGLGLWHVAVNLLLVALTVISWKLRPGKAMIR